MWPFSSKNRSGTAQEPVSLALEHPQALVSKLSSLEVTLGNLVSSQTDLERQHRSDHLELLDLHERVKKSLAKMNRRAQSDRAELDPEEQDQPQPGPAVSRVLGTSRLLSRRSR